VSPRLRGALGAAMLVLAVAATAATEPAPSPSITGHALDDNASLTASRPTVVRHARVHFVPAGGPPNATAEIRFWRSNPAVDVTVVRDSDGAGLALEPLRESGQSAVLGFTFAPFASVDPGATYDEIFTITLTATGDSAFAPSGSTYDLTLTAAYGGPPPPGASLSVTITDASPWPLPSGGSPAASGP